MPRQPVPDAEKRRGVNFSLPPASIRQIDELCEMLREEGRPMPGSRVVEMAIDRMHKAETHARGLGLQMSQLKSWVYLEGKRLGLRDRQIIKVLEDTENTKAPIALMGRDEITNHATLDEAIKAASAYYQKLVAERVQ